MNKSNDKLAILSCSAFPCNVVQANWGPIKDFQVKTYVKFMIAHFVLRVTGSNFKIIVFIVANCAGPDEMPHFAAFHLSLHCLSK